MNALIACGGTGGHLFPGLAVGEALVARGDRVMLVISEKEIDRIATANLNGMETAALPAIAMPPIYSPRIIPFGFKFLAALRDAGTLINKFQPDVVLGMGGFTCAAPILAARKRGIPTFLHESNAIPGKANRWLARRVTEVFVGFEECADKFSPRATVTGTPVRASLVRIPKTEARQKLGLDPDRFTVLVIGGSQGAQTLNRDVPEAIHTIDRAFDLGHEELQGKWVTDYQKTIQIIHLTGQADYEEVKRWYDIHGYRALVLAFCDQMDLAYSSADVAISRAGAAALTELAWFGIPSLLIPYPHAADHHQHRNAEVFTKACTAKVVNEDSAYAGAVPEHVLHKREISKFICDMQKHPESLREMSNRIYSLRRPDAAAKIIERMDVYRRTEATATGKQILSIAML